MSTPPRSQPLDGMVLLCRASDRRHVAVSRDMLYQRGGMQGQIVAHRTPYAAVDAPLNLQAWDHRWHTVWQKPADNVV